jgi:putative FmdB family regulatory protein
MPIFEYLCKACGEDFETFCLRDGEGVFCPACGSPDLKKKVSRVGSSSSGCFEPSPAGGGG